MVNKYSERHILANMGWKFFERGAAVIVTLVVNIVLARLLNPSDFGLVAMVNVFVTLSNIFVTSGLGNALVQKKETDDLDFSSMFWLNILVSAILYIFLFFASPLIASYYGYDLLSPMLKVLSLSLIIAAVNSIQCAYISRNMLFRNYFFSTLSGKILSGIIGIAMAYFGFGCWALVFQSLLMTLFATLVLWFTMKWRPQIKFSLLRVKGLYAFAWKIMLMSFIEAINDQLRTMFIGKKYTSGRLAFYDKGLLFPNTIVTNISSSLSAVMFPVLSNKQDDPVVMKQMLSRWLSLFAYCVFPILTGLALVARLLITLLLTEKWLPAVPYLQIACGFYAAWIIEIPIRETIKSMGYADVCLRIQIIKTLFALFALLVVMNWGVLAIAYTSLVCAFFNVALSIFYGRKYVGYKLSDLLTDIHSTMCINALMAIGVFAASLIPLSNSLKLLVQIVVGITEYLALSILSKNSNYYYCLNLILGIKKVRINDNV